MNRLGLVTYVAREYDEAIGFFVGKLGFTLVEDTDLGDGKRWVVVSAGEGASLLIARAEGEQQEASIGNQTGGRVSFFLHHVALCFANSHDARCMELLPSLKMCMATRGISFNLHDQSHVFV